MSAYYLKCEKDGVDGQAWSSWDGPFRGRRVANTQARYAREVGWTVRVFGEEAADNWRQFVDDANMWRQAHQEDGG